MRWHNWLLAFIGTASLVTAGHAQIPGAIPPASAAAPAAQGAAPVAAAGDVGFCAKCFQACEDCKRKICAMPLGTMLNSMTKPMSVMSGGIIPGFCPEKPGAEDLAKPGVEGASAQAKKDALEAKARRQAVRYLGTLDCRYYPEAEGALIAALRTDGVECVRWEAAQMLGHGCCCSKKIIEALTCTVSGSEKDGNPAEHSDRVRFSACLALERCVACYSEPVAEPEVIKPRDKEQPNPEKKEQGKGDAEQKSSRTPDRKTILAARDAIKQLHVRYGLETTQQPMMAAQEPARLVPMPTQVVMSAAQTSMPAATVAQRREPKSLFGVIRNSMGYESTTTTPVMVVQQPIQELNPTPMPMRSEQVRSATINNTTVLNSPSIPATFIPKLPETSGNAGFVIFEDMQKPKK